MKQGTDASGGDLVGPRPPALAVAALRLALPVGDRDVILGDLQEMFETTAADTSTALARRDYVMQALRSIWPALSLHATGKGVAQVFTAFLVGFATMWIVGDTILIGSRAGLAALSLADVPNTLTLRLTYLASMIPTCFLAGYLTERTGGQVGRLAVMALIALLVLPALIAPLLGHGGDPLWTRLVWLGGAPLATLLGASLSLRRAAARSATG